VRTGKAVGILIVAAAGATGLLAYHHLPVQMASHWNATGQADGYTSRFWGATFLPLIMAGLFGLLMALPSLDPRKVNIQGFRAAYDGVVAVILLFLFAIYGYTIAWNLGHPFPFEKVLLPTLAVFFWMVGSLLRKAQPSHLIGIRTPWTLESPLVWQKTHAFGARVLQAAGLVFLIGLFFPGYGSWFILLPILLALVVTLAYSYLISRHA
jgi:uncharacterized membrane protein